MQFSLKMRNKIRQQTTKPFYALHFYMHIFIGNRKVVAFNITHTNP